VLLQRRQPAESRNNSIDLLDLWRLVVRVRVRGSGGSAQNTAEVSSRKAIGLN
jgi:hypothetical protein